jgi:hypothetical protein
MLIEATLEVDFESQREEQPTTWPTVVSSR